MSLSTTTDCTPANCGCKARTAEDALTGAVFAAGRAKDRTEARESARALLWVLREYGWSVTRDDA